MRNLIHKIFEKRLLIDLKKIDTIEDGPISKLDSRESFSAGYANGFVKGFYFASSFIYGLTILLIVAIIVAVVF